MKTQSAVYRLAILMMLLVVISCTVTKKATVSTSDLDGSTQERAVIVASIDAEYAWIRQKYPGAKVTSQALIENGKKYYDLLTFTTPGGETKKAYFDINSFFGKF